MDGGKIVISGRVDRVDEFVQENTYAIVDYKLSGLPTVDLDHGKAIQVLLYTRALESSRGIKVGLAEYVSITKLQRRRALGLEDKREKTEYALGIAEDAISSIRNGVLAFSDEDCSEQCQFRFLCKRDWTNELLGKDQQDAGCTGVDAARK
jgi:hypothetical protein